MKLIALTGKSKAGKTTLAKALEKEGYMLINFTDILKREAAAILEPYGNVYTVRDINENKEKYRGFLQELGVHIGFDTNPEWVNHSLQKWSSTYTRDGEYDRAVFDNVRTPEQWRVLQSHGFKLVRLHSTRNKVVHWQPITEVVNHLTLGTPYTHIIESALDHVEADLTLNGDLEVEYLVYKILNS